MAARSSKIPVAPKPKAPVRQAPARKAPARKAPAKKAGPAPKGGASGAEQRANARASSAEKRANARNDAAQAKQDKKELDAKKAASKRYVGAAETLGLQADALRAALAPTGMKARLDQMLANVQLQQTQGDETLLSGFNARVGSLTVASLDNDKAAAGDSFANLSNAGRERANALSEATTHGAGESDVLASQGAALRNWNANQSEVNRAFFDSRTSINSSITDLNVDTRTARINNVAEANSDRSQLWTNYYDNRAESLTQLGNTLGQMSEDYGLANEQVATKLTPVKKGASKYTGLSLAQQKGNIATGKALGQRVGPNGEIVPKGKPIPKPFVPKIPTGRQSTAVPKIKNPTTADLQKSTSTASGKAFMDAAKETDNAYKDPGVPDTIRNWGGAAKFEAPMLQNQSLSASPQRAKPQGATLRKWSA